MGLLIKNLISTAQDKSKLQFCGCMEEPDN